LASGKGKDSRHEKKLTWLESRSSLLWSSNTRRGQNSPSKSVSPPWREGDQEDRKCPAVPDREPPGGNEDNHLENQSGGHYRRTKPSRMVLSPEEEPDMRPTSLDEVVAKPSTRKPKKQIKLASRGFRTVAGDSWGISVSVHESSDSQPRNHPGGHVTKEG